MEIVTDTKKYPPSTVILNVYDLMPNRYTKIAASLGVGLHHSSIEIYGVEFMYGCGAGIVIQDETKVAGGAIYRESHILGSTDLNIHEIESLAVDFIEKHGYKGDAYHLLNKNCNHFASDFGKALITTIPKIINSKERNENVEKDIESLELNQASTLSTQDSNEIEKRQTRVEVMDVTIPRWVNRLAWFGSWFACCMPLKFVKPQLIEINDEQAIVHDMEMPLQQQTKSSGIDGTDIHVDILSS